MVRPNREQLAGHEVVAEIDHNKRNLGREDAKYYQVILAPSQAELAHIGKELHFKPESADYKPWIC